MFFKFNFIILLIVYHCSVAAKIRTLMAIVLTFLLKICSWESQIPPPPLMSPTQSLK